MPCDSRYLEPNDREVEGSKVIALLNELEIGYFHDLFGTGYTVRAGSYYTGDLDADVERLCARLQGMSPENILASSLELQMWWRDHQEADRERLKQEVKDTQNEVDRRNALNKLTSYERGLLGV